MSASLSPAVLAVSGPMPRASGPAVRTPLPIALSLAEVLLLLLLALPFGCRRAGRSAWRLSTTDCATCWFSTSSWGVGVGGS